MRLVRFAALALVPCSVVAWGWQGHEIVGTIAQMYLDPGVLRNVCTILGEPGCHLGPLGRWADDIKGPQYRGRYKWASVLHYVNPTGDNPRETCIFGDQGWDGDDGLNVLGAIRNVTDFLIDRRTGSDEALKFLIHFMGDMHQPLHLTGREKGGNNVDAAFKGRRTEFHAIWDTDLPKKAMDKTPSKYNQPTGDDRIESVLLGGKVYNGYVRKIVVEGLERDWKDEITTWTACPRTASPPSSQLVLQHREQGPQDWDDATVCPFAWASEIHAANCDFVWPEEYDSFSVGDNPRSRDASGDFPYLDLNEGWYSDPIMNNKVIDKFLALAGVRLAAVLNHALGP